MRTLAKLAILVLRSEVLLRRVVLVLALGLTSASPAAEDTWTRKAGVPIQRGEVGFRRKYLAFLVFNRTYPARSLGNSLKLRRGFGIIGREFYWSVSGKL